jgi:hypothetical protein
MKGDNSKDSAFQLSTQKYPVRPINSPPIELRGRQAELMVHRKSSEEQQRSCSKPIQQPHGSLYR